MNTITRDMTIGTVVEKYPEVVDTLLGFGVHCVGCHVSPYETLEMGLAGHGFGDEEINSAVAKLNEVLDKSEKTVEEEQADLGVTLTEAAVAKLKTMLPANNKKALRLKIKPGGCSGFEYKFSLDDEDSKEDDFVVMQDSAVLYVDKVSLQKVSGSLIDYMDTLQDAGFKVTNPNAEATCGCGSSFS